MTPYDNLTAQTYRFEMCDGLPGLRLMIEGRPTSAYIVVELKKELSDYTRLPMSDESRAALGRWWEGELSKPF